MTAAGGRSASALRSTISPSRQSRSICGPLRTSNLACGWGKEVSPVWWTSPVRSTRGCDGLDFLNPECTVMLSRAATELNIQADCRDTWHDSDRTTKANNELDMPAQ